MAVIERKWKSIYLLVSELTFGLDPSPNSHSSISFKQMSQRVALPELFVPCSLRQEI